jgi:hypothetical protein
VYRKDSSDLEARVMCCGTRNIRARDRAVPLSVGPTLTGLVAANIVLLPW